MPRRPRFIAPWHRDSLRLESHYAAAPPPRATSSAPAPSGSAPEGMLAGVGIEVDDPDQQEALAALLASLDGKPALYHCLSRVVDGRFALLREEREHFLWLMRRYERFCQVRVITHCVMSNHFHLLLEVPAPPEDRGASWSDQQLLAHLECLYSKDRVRQIRSELEGFRAQGNTPGAEALRGTFFARMWDLSAYMKLLKQCFTQWFNARHERRGTLWEQRFQSVLVESGHAARRVAAYIDLNALRAGMVSDPKDYRWCGYAEAVAGKGRAREGLRLVLFELLRTVTSEQRAAKEVAPWREVVRLYRRILFEDGERRGRDVTKGRAGIAPHRVAEVLARGGELSEGQLLACRVRYFIDGLVIGSEGFVNAVFGARREYFGPRRRSGARRMRQVRSELRTARDLRVGAIRVSDPGDG